MEVFVGIIAVVVVVVLGISLRRQRKRAAAIDLEDKSWLRQSTAEADPLAGHAPVADFHVRGDEARVTFDVPLPDEPDPVLNDLLLDEAVEVVRERKHSLPIGDVTQIVVFAGREDLREVARTKLPSPGELPPPVPGGIISFSHLAKDPFAGEFDVDHTVRYETAARVPDDDLGPLRDEIKVPVGLERGLRARGVDPDKITGPEFILALLELFEYHVAALEDPGSHIATKGNTRTYVRTVPHNPGDHPELSEGVIKRFAFEFSTSGADRGMLITEKYGPFMVHDIERNEPRIRFITRERIQRFVDSMALG